MNDFTVCGIQEELRFAKAKWGPLLEGWEEDIASFTGPGYRKKTGRRGLNMPENHAFEWFSLMLLDLTMGNPRVRISTDRSGPAQNRATALTYGVNSWSRQTKSREVFEQLAMDFGLRFCVALVTSEPRQGFDEYDDPPYWPAIHRIPPKHFLSDAAAESPRSAVWSAHLVIDTLENIKRQAGDPDSGWDMSVLDKLELSKGEVNKFRPSGTEIPDRKEVAYWEFHVPGKELKESPGAKKGYHGTIYTVIDGQSDRLGFPRKPRPYFGPRTGPYLIGGCYVVPDNAAPLSSITATKAQEVYLNRIATSIRVNVEAYKRLIFVGNGNSTLAQSIKDGKDLWVHTIAGENVRDGVVSQELGGITQNHMVAKEDARNTLKQVSGITDAMQGNVTGDATATENALAGTAATKRITFIASKFKAFTADCLKNVAYFIDRDEDVVMELGPEANGKIMGPDGNPLPGPIRLSGGGKGQKASDFELMSFQVEVGSMERNLEQDADRKMAIIDQTLQLLMNAASFPFLDIQKYLDVKAELTGVEELRGLIDVRILMMMAASQMGQGAQPAQGQGSQGQPRSKSIIYGTMSGSSQSSKQVNQRMGATASAARSGPAQQAKSALGGGQGY